MRKAIYACLLLPALLFVQQLQAHNGVIAYAYPLGKIIVDGNLSDWPQDGRRYAVNTLLSESKPNGDDDFSAWFQVGYRQDNRSFYIALTITDNDFVEDTSANVRFNSQDCLELCIDGRHLPFGSGVASFMYSKKLRNINNSFYDPFTSKASWDIMEVAVSRNGNTRTYEWRVDLGNELEVGKSIGIDFNIFDKDTDGSFTAHGWGKGSMKIRNPNHLGDVLLLPSKEKLARVQGKVNWDNGLNEKLPGSVRLVSTDQPKRWIQAEVDSTGTYLAEVPEGKYDVSFTDDYYRTDKHVYSTVQQAPHPVAAKAGKQTVITPLILRGIPAPDLIPDKGVLPKFDEATAARVDSFISTYQKYYLIPGVSLALVKDGKMIYHKTYGVGNAVTGKRVDDNTLFEAASITKPVFAYVVQRLAERGTIDLDKPLYQYLPYADIEYDERYKLMTARHVLTHRTGFPNWRSMNDDGKLNLRFTPGTDFNYSGEGFEYLKLVVEKITGKKVEQVLQEEVITPIGLYHTFFSRNDSLRAMVANGHYDMLPTFDELNELPGMAWSMRTEAAIFTRFMINLLEQKGLDANTYSTMFKKHSDYKYDPGEEMPRYPSYMGMSLEIRETPYGKTFGHGGNNGDFKCKFEVYQDLKMGYVIFTNSNTSDALLEAIRSFLVEGKDPSTAAH